MTNLSIWHNKTQLAIAKRLRISAAVVKRCTICAHLFSNYYCNCCFTAIILDNMH